MNAEAIIATLELVPHPEGGFYREMFRDAKDPEERGASTAIYFLLLAGQRSHWHRVDAAEVWHWYAGAPLLLSIASKETAKPKDHLLGTNFGLDERPQIIVPKDHWQSAESLGDFTLAGCTVAPGFTFEGFEMGPSGWHPGAA